MRLLLFFAVDMFVLVLVPAFTSTLDAGVSLYINLGLAVRNPFYSFELSPYRQ